MISSQGCIFFKKELICLWNSILPEPGPPSAKLSKLIRLTAFKKTKHSVSRWYRTVYILWLVASYDTHKGKRWLNSDPHKPQGPKLNPVNEFPNISTANRPPFMRFYIIQKYVSVINIESAISIMSAPTKWIIDNPKLAFLWLGIMFLYLNTYCIYFTKNYSLSQKPFILMMNIKYSVGFH